MTGSKLTLAAIIALVLGMATISAGCSPDSQDAQLPDTAKELFDGEKEGGTVEQHESTIDRDVPLIDQTVPGNLETATFGLG